MLTAVLAALLISLPLAAQDPAPAGEDSPPAQSPPPAASPPPAESPPAGEEEPAETGPADTSDSRRAAAAEEDEFNPTQEVEPDDETIFPVNF
jgi:hypothetical protein